jgi:hypothetical protein
MKAANASSVGAVVSHACASMARVPRPHAAPVALCLLDGCLFQVYNSFASWFFCLNWLFILCVMRVAVCRFVFAAGYLWRPC